MADPEQLAARAFRAAEYDFSRLMDLPDALMSRADRHGVRLLIAPTFALPDAALDAILSWRLGQYLLTQFYDADVVASKAMTREDASGVHAADVHGLAIDADGGLLTYLTLKQPDGPGRWASWDLSTMRTRWRCLRVPGATSGIAASSGRV